LENRNKRWNAIHDRIENHLKNIKNVKIIEKHQLVKRTPSSIQFLLYLDSEKIEKICKKSFEYNVPIKWFGSSIAHGFTSTHKHWKWVESKTNSDY